MQGWLSSSLVVFAGIAVLHGSVGAQPPEAAPAKPPAQGVPAVAGPGGGSPPSGDAAAEAPASPAEAGFPKCAVEKTCWEIACAQLCGLSHYSMRGFLTVHQPGGFEDWLDEQSAG